MSIRRLLPLVAVLAVAGLVLAQPPVKKADPAPKAKEPPKPAPGSLEDTLEKALRNSADIKAAEAKVRDAEAELNRVRQQVLTRATALHADLNLAKRMLAVAEQSLAIQQRARETAQGTLEGVLAAQAMVEKHRGEMEKLEAELKSLRGEFAVHWNVTNVAFTPDGRLLGSPSPDGTMRMWDVVSGRLVVNRSESLPAAPVQPSMMDRVKALLDREVSFGVSDADVEAALQGLMDVAGNEVPLRVILPKELEGRVTLRGGKLNVGACLQAIEDSSPELRVVVRDYGLLATTRDRVPEGAPRALDVWKGVGVPAKKSGDVKVK